ncbi:MAG TPA: hypothetical protein VFV08_02410, partial [Puia sp.]|nr:hypothetical protein [Puia sp.]
MPLNRPMEKPYVAFCAILLLLLIGKPVQAQVNANFTPDKTAGCAPLAVHFTNTTTGAVPGSTYTWNFGNGNTITTTDAVTPVAATYLTP